MKAVRCAIYTRKSSDEGLEQSFNSLDAQREACAAYILSQASEGWTALPDIYDDGGLSGGTLERPALQRLLTEVAASRVDIIVVYKVDRLTRSLFDFAKLVETFDKAGTSFVSVTQSFNTTTSMGRLTLNMLLSFAQFEREVTAERIRDKIAASKAKGMWMGGTPPLGYRPDGRSLTPVDEHAAIIRQVFTRYLALGNVRHLEAELAGDGITLPIRQRVNGNGSYGGGAFTRGQLYKILSNPIYIGRIAHGAKHYAGQHPAIIDTEQWEAVQAKLADNRQGHRSGVRAASPSLLAGRVVDPSGEPLIASHTTKQGRRYRYYVGQALHQGMSRDGSRFPARELETAVAARLTAAFDDPMALAASCSLSLTAAGLSNLHDHAAATAALLHRRDRSCIHGLVDRVVVHPDRVDAEMRVAAIADALRLAPTDTTPERFTLSAAVALTRTGRAVKLVHDNGAAASSAANPALVRLLVKARRWWTILREGEVDVTTLAAREGVQPSYLTRVLRLAFLSPEVTAAALRGELHAGIDTAALVATGGVSNCWRQQAVALLPTRP